MKKTTFLFFLLLFLWPPQISLADCVPTYYLEYDSGNDPDYPYCNTSTNELKKYALWRVTFGNNGPVRVTPTGIGYCSQARTCWPSFYSPVAFAIPGNTSWGKFEQDVQNKTTDFSNTCQNLGELQVFYKSSPCQCPAGYYYDIILAECGNRLRRRNVNRLDGTGTFRAAIVRIRRGTAR